MTAEQFLEQQEKKMLGELQRTTLRMGKELGNSIDLPGVVDRHPVLSLAAGVAGGFLVGNLLVSGSRHVTRGVITSLLRPLFRPTLAGLGTALGGLIVGGPIDRDQPE